MKNNINISSPWIGYYHKLCAFFGPDPDVDVKFDEKSDEIKLYVTGEDKYGALTALMPDEVTFGNVTIKVTVVPSNKLKTMENFFKDALEGNPLYSDVIKIDVPGSINSFTYVMFEPRVIHYWDDNLGDPHGNVATLAQDLAKEIFTKIDGVFYCTEEEYPEDLM